MVSRGRVVSPAGIRAIAGVSRDTLKPLLEAGEEAGCLNLSEFSAADAGSRARRGRARGSCTPRSRSARITLTDDCGREAADDATYVNGDLAQATTDSLQLFLNEAGRYPLLTAAEEVELAKRVERGDPAGEGPDDQLEPPARRLDREALPGSRPVAARPDPGGRDRADPRGREVRLAPRLQVLHLCDVVDPPGRAARRGEQVAHDPDPGAHRRARAADRPRRAGAERQARPPADRRRDLEGREALAQASARGALGGARRHQPRQAARRRQRRLDRRPRRRLDQQAVEEEVQVSLTEATLHRALEDLPEREVRCCSSATASRRRSRSRSRRSGAGSG